MLNNFTWNIKAKKLRDSKENVNANVDWRPVKLSTFKKIARHVGSAKSFVDIGNTEQIKYPLLLKCAMDGFPNNKQDPPSPK